MASESGPPDGYIASAEISIARNLDEQTSERWQNARSKRALKSLNGHLGLTTLQLVLNTTSQRRLGPKLTTDTCCVRPYAFL